MPMADDLKTPEGITGPDEKVSVSGLILQRLEDLKDQITDLRQDLTQFKQTTEHRFDILEHRWSWSIGLIAVMALGLLAKLLIPGA